MKRIRCSAAIVLCSLFFAIVALAVPSTSQAQIGIGVSVSFGPPALPVYEQPVCPGDGYLWTPGYWAYGPDGYYWVPGTWVLAPRPGFLWTPGWWGWGGSAFIFHVGYWGPHIGFYGGINYGFGYFGTGFVGGRWDGGHFFYNRAVMNVNVTNIHNVYNTTIVNNTTVNRVSYNGGNGGINARPTPEEERAEHEQHLPPVAEQTRHEEAARNDPQQRASFNHGRPPVAATDRPGQLKGAGVVPAREAGAPYHPPAGGERGNGEAGRPENNVPRPPADAKDLKPHERMPAPNTGNAKLDQKYQKQQDKLYQKQEQEHQKLAQKQEQEHQRAAQQKMNDSARQQMEQRHAQQTAQMEQRHAQQQQHIQQRERPAGEREK